MEEAWRVSSNSTEGKMENYWLQNQLSLLDIGVKSQYSFAQGIKKTENDLVNMGAQYCKEGFAYIADGKLERADFSFLNAVGCFAKAIKANSTNHSVYLQRAVCFQQLESYQKSLEDAEKALELDNTDPYGYLVKGLALLKLKHFVHAGKAFMQALDLKPGYPEALEHLQSIRQYLPYEVLYDVNCNSLNSVESFEKEDDTVDVVFTPVSDVSVEELAASLPSSRGGSPQQAPMDYAQVLRKDNKQLQGKPAPQVRATSAPPEVEKPSTSKNPGPGPKSVKGRKAATPKPTSSRAKPEAEVAGAKTVVVVNQQPQNAVNRQKDPRNPDGHRTLWVGNLYSVSEKQLRSACSRYGTVLSVTVIEGKNYGFVNFADKEGATACIANLQNSRMFGKKLVLKFPPSPTAAQPAKPSQQKKKSKSGPLHDIPQNVDTKPRSPKKKTSNKRPELMKTEECVNWRLNGQCDYGLDCWFLHHKENKGIGNGIPLRQQGDQLE